MLEKATGCRSQAPPFPRPPDHVSQSSILCSGAVVSARVKADQRSDACLRTSHSGQGLSYFWLEPVPVVRGCDNTRAASSAPSFTLPAAFRTELILTSDLHNCHIVSVWRAQFGAGQCYVLLRDQHLRTYFCHCLVFALKDFYFLLRTTYTYSI